MISRIAIKKRNENYKKSFLDDTMYETVHIKSIISTECFCVRGNKKFSFVVAQAAATAMRNVKRRKKTKNQRRWKHVSEFVLEERLMLMHQCFSINFWIEAVQIWRVSSTQFNVISSNHQLDYVNFPRARNRRKNLWACLSCSLSLTYTNVAAMFFILKEFSQSLSQLSHKTCSANEKKKKIPREPT